MLLASVQLYQSARMLHFMVSYICVYVETTETTIGIRATLVLCIIFYLLTFFYKNIFCQVHKMDRTELSTGWKREQLKYPSGKGSDEVHRRKEISQ